MINNFCIALSNYQRANAIYGIFHGGLVCESRMLPAFAWFMSLYQNISEKCLFMTNRCFPKQHLDKLMYVYVYIYIYCVRADCVWLDFISTWWFILLFVKAVDELRASSLWGQIALALREGERGRRASWGLGEWLLENGWFYPMGMLLNITHVSFFFF